VDADLYSSALFILASMAGRLRAGDVVLFDEFSDALHEYRAFQDASAAFYLPLTPIGQANDCMQVAFRVG
jgi:hypothetical protein